jgi:glycine cleavage system T protein (aminomethyltransferase)
MSKTDDKSQDAEDTKAEATTTPEGEGSSETSSPLEVPETSVEAVGDEGTSSASAEDVPEQSTKSEDNSDEPGSPASNDDDKDAETKPRARRARRSRTRRKPRSNDAGDDDQGSNGNSGAAADDLDKPKLKATALWGLHKERRAKMVPFAGYEMPVQYKRGIMAEHRQTRTRVGLFDVSHMGQAFLSLEGKGGHEEIAGLMEELVPGSIKGLKPGGIRYTLLLNDEGGIIDDLMVTRPEGDAGDGMLFLVVNAGCKEKDFSHISAKLEGRAKLTIAGDRALIALQGPQAAEVMARHAPFVPEMKFMTAMACRIDGVECIVSRCGYTGEDGFEISVPNEMADSFTRKLLAHREVALAGLGSRDSLRLEAGLCLYGHELDEETTPAEAGLIWAIAKRRKLDKDFPGAEKIMNQVLEGTTRKRVGIRPEGKAPARDGTEVVDPDGKVIGKVTSGGFGPTVRGPIAMAYVDASVAEEGSEVALMVRGQARPAKVVPLPFIESRQHRPGLAKVETPAETPVETQIDEPSDDPAEVPVEEPIEDAPLEEVSPQEGPAETEASIDAEAVEESKEHGEEEDGK